jgi:NADH dehydrogenase
MTPPMAKLVDSQTKTILVLGGGFAGSTVVKPLQRKLPADYKVVMVSEESTTTFHPMLPEAVGASIFPEQVVAPLREIVKVQEGHRFVMGRATSIDLPNKTITCQSLAGELVVPYDHLILAVGSRARIDFLPGMAAFALPLKTVGDAMKIRNTLLRRLAEAELTDDLEEQSRLIHFCVIGGGFSGVEVAGELVDFLKSALRYYPRVPASSVKVSVLHDGARLLPELPELLGNAALLSLQKRGVKVYLQATAQSIHQAGLQFTHQQSEHQLHARTVICTIGNRPNELINGLNLPCERGRLITDAQMRVPGFEGLWALGDCAAVPNAHSGSTSPPTAQFAVRQAKLLANNILRAIEQHPQQVFRYQALGSMAAIGHMKGVAQIGPLQLHGLWAWFLWRAYYLSQMPTLRRKLRVYVEWTWGMFFAADITHLRFLRSKDLKNEP